MISINDKIDMKKNGEKDIQLIKVKLSMNKNSFGYLHSLSWARRWFEPAGNTPGPSSLGTSS